MRQIYTAKSLHRSLAKRINEEEGETDNFSTDLAVMARILCLRGKYFLGTSLVRTLLCT